MTAKRSFFLVMLALGLGEITCAFESSMIYMVLSSLYKEFGDPVRVGWLLTAFTLTAAGSAALCGRLGDLFGRRRVLLIMLGLALCGSLLSAFAPNLEFVIIGRALQGCSMAVLPLCLGLLREMFDADQVTRGVGLLGGAFAFGSGLGLIVGGVIVDHVGWHSIFLVSACTACLTILLTLLFVPSLKPAPRTGRLDIVGGVLFAPAVCMVLLAVSQASTIAAHSYTTITLAVFGFLGLVFWISHELRHENPLIDVRILKNRQVLWANISIFFAGMGPLISVTVIMPFFQQPVWTGAGFGIPATAAALIKLPANGTSVIAAIVAGYAASRYGVRTVLLWAAFISTVGWALVVAANTSLVVIAVLQIIALAPVQSVLFSLTPRAIMQVAPQDRTSEATGLTQVIRALGQAVGVQMMAMLLASSMVSRAGEGRFPAHSSYILAFVYIGIFSFLIWLALLALPREKPGYHLPS